MKRQGLEPTKKVAYFEWDFAIDGGAIGEIALRGDRLPDDAVVQGGSIQANTAVTSGGAATLALKLVAAGDIKAATGVASFFANALMVTVPVPGTAATWVRTTSGGLGVVLTVAAFALTAGKITVALEYFA